MHSRGKQLQRFEGRSVQVPGILRHGPFPGLGGVPTNRCPLDLEITGSQRVGQAAEMEQVVADNRRLAATHIAMREDLTVVQEEIQKVKAHIRSIQTESDIQMRVLLEKTTKLGADIRVGEHIKRELQEAHMEAHSLATSRQELSFEIQKATQELQRVQTDVLKLPEMLAELNSLRLEHQKLRSSFEYEKGLNIELVEQMQATEKDLMDMVQQLQKLRSEVLNAEKRARVSGSGAANLNPGPYPLVQGDAAYVDEYVRPYPQKGVSPAGEIPNPYSITNDLTSSYPAGQGSAAFADGYGRPSLQTGVSQISENANPYNITGGSTGSGVVGGALVPGSGSGSGVVDALVPAS